MILWESMSTSPPLGMASTAYSETARGSSLPPSLASMRGERRPTIVLDLDETLVHASVAPTPKDDFSFSFLFGGASHTMYVRRRPFLDKLLQALRGGPWEVVVFTASVRAYADRLLDVLDPDGAIFDSRLYREHCTPLEGCYTKDLRALGRPLHCRGPALSGREHQSVGVGGAHAAGREGVGARRPRLDARASAHHVRHVRVVRRLWGARAQVQCRCHACAVQVRCMCRRMCSSALPMQRMCTCSVHAVRLTSGSHSAFIADASALLRAW